ncbi:MAG: adenylate/guanylate cyclase domain-containing protein [Planctomycetes bacterium]|nr:adenylate/guanylate cyclase domain-containing protein [Planctomycetota bacterium]
MLNHVLLPTSHCVTYPAMQARLNKLLAERAGKGSDKAAIDDQIWDLYGETWAVMFTDLAGFSGQVAHFGVTHFLQVIFESFRIYIPIVEEHSGLLLKVEGDSMMVLFRRPKRALECAVAMQRAGWAYNKDREDTERLLLSVGLGFGRVLKFGDQDVYGGEVNVACKLGEDLGRHWMIQCSQEFHDAVKDDTELKLEHAAETPAGTPQAWQVIYDKE